MISHSKYLPNIQNDFLC